MMTTNQTDWMTKDRIKDLYQLRASVSQAEMATRTPAHVRSRVQRINRLISQVLVSLLMVQR